MTFSNQHDIALAETMLNSTYWRSEDFVEIPSQIPPVDQLTDPATLFARYLTSKEAHVAPTSIEAGRMIPVVGPQEGFVVVTIENYVRQDTRGFVGALGRRLYERAVGKIGVVKVTPDFTNAAQQMTVDPWYSGKAAEASRFTRQPKGWNTHEVCSRYVAYISANPSKGFYTGVTSEAFNQQWSNRLKLSQSTLFLPPLGHVSYGDIEHSNMKFFARCRVVAAAVHLTARG